MSAKTVSIAARLLGCILAGGLLQNASQKTQGQEGFFSQQGSRFEDLAVARSLNREDASLWPKPRESAAPPIEQKLGLADRIEAITRGRVQIECGYVFVYDRVDAVQVVEHSVPDLLLRVGLNERLELRLGWPGYVSTHYDGPFGGGSSEDMLDPNVGLMLDLSAQQGWFPQTAVLAAAPITLRGNPFALASMQPLNQLLYRWYLHDRLAVGGTTGIALFREDGDSFVQFQQSLNLDFLLTDRLGTFLEWELLADHDSADDGSQHLLGGGLSFLLTNRLQLGWRAGLGLNRRAPDFLTGVRLSFRF